MPNLSNYENPTEDLECEAFHQWLELKNLPHTHIGNESGRGRTAMLRTAKLKRMGQSRGFPDFLVVIPNASQFEKLRVIAANTGYGHTDNETGEMIMEPKEKSFIVTDFDFRLIAIEMKRKRGGKVSSEQKRWIEILNAAGIESVVCRGFEEAKRFIEERI